MLGDTRLPQRLRAAITAGHFTGVLLKRHARSRSTDENLLRFLDIARGSQPTKETLRDFFEDRIFSRDRHVTMRKLLDLEKERDKEIVVLTVTNHEADKWNRARLAIEFPQVIEAMETCMVRGDPEFMTGPLEVAPQVRLRLTKNLDKDRGFVNGAMTVVQHVLRKDVYVVARSDGVLNLVHPTRDNKGRTMVPATYAYATTIRRVQGATLPAVALRFDRRLPDRGYAFVGASRVRAKTDVYHISCLRRTDWLPVGKANPQKEQLQTSCESIDSSGDEEFDDGAHDHHGLCGIGEYTDGESLNGEDEHEAPSIDSADDTEPSDIDDTGKHGLQGISLQCIAPCTLPMDCDVECLWAPKL